MANTELVKEAEARQILGGVSASTFFRGIASGRFPRGVKVGPNSTRYVRSELNACVAQMIAARR